MNVAIKHAPKTPSADKNPEKNHVQVIARAASIMRALEDTTTGLSLGEIAIKVGLARSTVQRIVAALESEKLVVAASPAGRVRLGPTILRLAGSVRTDFVALAKPFLVELSKELHETVDLASIKGDHLVFIDQVIGSQRLRTVSAVGESFPLTGGHFNGRPVARFAIQTSTNLATWTTILTTTNATSGLFNFIDPGSTSAPVRFYRAQSLP